MIVLSWFVVEETYVGQLAYNKRPISRKGSLRHHKCAEKVPAMRSMKTFKLVIRR